MFENIAPTMQKSFFKKLISNRFSNLSSPIIVNSYGRSGSSVLVKSIAKGAINTKFRLIEKLSTRYYTNLRNEWNLNAVSLQNGFVYKTHDYPPKQDFFNSRVRMIYIFADPVDVVLSLVNVYEEHGEEWMKAHFDHLQVPFKDFDNIIHKDELALEKHLSSWLQEDRFPIAFIKYRALWEKQDKLAEYIGIPFKLPVFKKRKSKNRANPELVGKLEKTYQSLRKKIDQLDDFFIQNMRD